MSSSTDKELHDAQWYYQNSSSPIPPPPFSLAQLGSSPMLWVDFGGCPAAVVLRLILYDLVRLAS
ncbi:hypothetical protein DAI22_03g220001 [Oryza sativa Japonica Group]|nr:hypothetical protein DAI22_03g220001 [Oryza sativa Japonica Group]